MESNGIYPSHTASYSFFSKILQFLLSTSEGFFTFHMTIWLMRENYPKQELKVLKICIRQFKQKSHASIPSPNYATDLFK